MKTFSFIIFFSRTIKVVTNWLKKISFTYYLNLSLYVPQKIWVFSVSSFSFDSLQHQNTTFSPHHHSSISPLELQPEVWKRLLARSLFKYFSSTFQVRSVSSQIRILRGALNHPELQAWIFLLLLPFFFFSFLKPSAGCPFAQSGFCISLLRSEHRFEVL